MMRLGAYSISLPNLTPEQAVVAIRDAGCCGVEWRVAQPPAGVAGLEPDFFRNNRCTIVPTVRAAARSARLCAEARLEVIGLGTYIESGDLAAVTTSMELARAARAPWIRLRSPWRGEVSYRDLFARGTEFLRQVAGLAERYGIRALVEMHHRSITPSASLAQRLVSQFDPRLVGVIYDAGNLVIEGYEDHRTAVEILGPHLAHVHVKNAAYDRPPGGGVWTPRWTPMDDGILDVPQLLQVLADAEYQGWVSIEDFSTDRTPERTLEFDARFLRRHGAFSPCRPDGGVDMP